MKPVISRRRRKSAFLRSVVPRCQNEFSVLFAGPVLDVLNAQSISLTLTFFFFFYMMMNE